MKTLEAILDKRANLRAELSLFRSARSRYVASKWSSYTDYDSELKDVTLEPVRMMII